MYSYPKNQTSYSDIKILKKDLSTGKALANAEFRLEESTDGSTYKTKIANVKSGSNGMIEIASLDANKFYRLVETKAPSAEYILVRNITTPFYIDSEGQMYTGWTSISNKKPVGGTAVPNNMLELNNEKPTIHKSVLSGTKGTEGVDTTKKIGDYLTDLKLPPDEKEKVLVCAVGSEVLWVIGRRMADSAKLDDDTVNILKLEVKE